MIILCNHRDRRSLKSWS